MARTSSIPARAQGLARGHRPRSPSAGDLAAARRSARARWQRIPDVAKPMLLAGMMALSGGLPICDTAGD